MLDTDRVLAVVAAVVLVVGVVGATPALASDGSLSVSATQNDDGTGTVTVTHNNTTVEGASVEVSTTDPNATYDGTGSYSTDANGTVSLPAPSGNESVEVAIVASYDNVTASTTLTLAVVEEEDNGTFGHEVVAFIASLNESDHAGPLIASFVLANNPGNPPDHAGPPEWLVNGTAGPSSDNGTHGPPEHAGPPGDGNETGSNGNGGGPPEHAGASGGGNGNGGGPPEHAGPPTDEDDES